MQTTDNDAAVIANLNAALAKAQRLTQEREQMAAARTNLEKQALHVDQESEERERVFFPFYNNF